MIIHDLIVEIAEMFVAVDEKFIQTALSIRHVAILGKWLYAAFAMLGAYFGGVASRFVGYADEWLNFYNWVVDAIEQGTGLGILQQWAQALVDFISDVVLWFMNMFDAIFPDGAIILNDPFYFVESVARDMLGQLADFIANPYGKIRNMIINVIGILVSIRDDPYGFIRGIVESFNIHIPDFLSDPIAWVLLQVKIEWPDIMPLMEHPALYITDHVVDWLGSEVDFYADRLRSIANDAINKLF